MTPGRRRSNQLGERNRPGKARDVGQAVLIERGNLGGGCKWPKNLVDDGNEERFNKWTVCIEKRLKLIEMDSIDTLSSEEGENLSQGLKAPQQEGVG